MTLAEIWNTYNQLIISLGGGLVFVSSASWYAGILYNRILDLENNKIENKKLLEELKDEIIELKNDNVHKCTYKIPKPTLDRINETSKAVSMLFDVTQKHTNEIAIIRAEHDHLGGDLESIKAMLKDTNDMVKILVSKGIPDAKQN